MAKVRVTAAGDVAEPVIFATRDLPAGLTSLLERGPGKTVLEGRWPRNRGWYVR